MSLFIDSGVGCVLSMFCFIDQQKQVYNCKANDVGVVFNEWVESFMSLQEIVSKSLTR